MDVALSVPGEHNIKNALSAIGAAEFLGISYADIKKGLSAFCGTGRRFERKGKIDGAYLIDDYAHHPTEIKATLGAAQNVGNGRVFCIQTTLMQIGANSVGKRLNILSKRGIFGVILCILYIRLLCLIIFHNENTA